LASDVDQRAGWSGELRELLDRHPRETWARHRSPTIALWLDMHDGFRRECAALLAAADDYRAGRATAPQLAALTAPRLRGLIVHLHGHHETEDFHYFPVFRAGHPALAPALDALGADHARLQRDVSDANAALEQLLAASASGPTRAAEHAANSFVAASARLCGHLVRHLADEEDLVIPLLLERGD
jgi:hemerythrin HHE cation binding domain-containing protein